VEEAVKEYRSEVTLDPNDARARSDLGTALLARNDFPGAMRELTKAIELDPKRATFRSNLGYALQLQGKKDEAVASYREAIRLDDKLASAWINLATLLAKEPKTRAEARSALEKARALDPQDPRVVANLEELDALEKAQKKP
jgi:Flp pilus assembly protein TadD